MSPTSRRARKDLLLGRAAEMECEWLSVHMHVRGQRAGLYGDAADAAAVEIVAPFVAQCRARGWIIRYFFIRYREDGAHLRLRLCGAPSVLHSQVRPALIDFLHTISPGVRIEGEHRELAEGALPSLVGLVRWVPYEPEVERYGGPAALPVSEELFCASSDVALALLKHIRGQSTGVRLGRGLLSMLVVGHALLADRQRARHFFHQYRAGYLHSLDADKPALRETRQEQFDAGIQRQSDKLAAYVREAWRRLATGEAISEPVDQWTQAAGAAITKLRGLPTPEHTLHRIIASQLHMMNNRLGIRVDEEAYLAQACASGLGDEG